MTRFLLNLAVNVVASVFVTGAWVLLFDAEPVSTFWYCMAPLEALVAACVHAAGVPRE